MSVSGEQFGKPVRFNRQTLAGQVADELRRRILSGELVEGTQLLQEQLAAEFGMSKVPVREALFQLEAEGFVSQQFHRGAVVSGLSPAQVMEVFELRAQIEAWLLGLAMAAASADDIRAAEEVSAELVGTEDPILAWDLNWRFHEMLYRPANKPFVIDHLKKLHSQTARYVRLQYSHALDKNDIIKDHDEILALYSEKNAKAPKKLRDHILRSAKRLSDTLSQAQ